MTKTFNDGERVQVGFAQNIPTRYQGRTGVVVGLGDRNRFLVSFGARRATPLEVAPRFLKTTD